MSKRELILIGPAVGVLLITLALVFGYVIVPPMIIQRVTEVNWIDCDNEEPFRQEIYFDNAANSLRLRCLSVCLNV